ncbi:MAG: AI-2E family transporter, partial [Clostridia bacterium]|nr:AI-2E family transporter [Clostridia bacterium]
GDIRASAGVRCDFSDYVEKIVNSLGASLAEFSKNLVSKTPQMAATASGALLKVIICIISTAFLLTDYDLITNFIHKQMKPETSEKVKSVSSHLGKVLKKYILSYALIMFITFIEILVGLLIIRMPNAPLIASIVAVFDILPIVGSGMVLLPWALITLILGNVGRGIGLLILWAVVVVVRQIIEPKIVGTHVGMHPLLTLFAMIAGNFIYGGIGILLLPISLALIQSLNEDGVIHVYESLEEKDIPKEENGVIVTAVSKPMHSAWSTVRRLNSKARRDLEEAREKAEKKKNEAVSSDRGQSSVDAEGKNGPAKDEKKDADSDNRGHGRKH